MKTPKSTKSSKPKLSLKEANILSKEKTQLFSPKNHEKYTRIQVLIRKRPLLKSEIGKIDMISMPNEVKSMKI